MKKTATINKANSPEKYVSKKRLFLFKIVAVLIPFIILFIAEAGLHLFGYGHNLTLFVEDPQHKDYLVMNRYASEKFFSDPATATIGNSELFRKQKQPGYFRIFVLGESTTIGYPYMHNGSFHRWLQYRLMHTFPDINFEIINLSLTAVNSYTVLDFGKEIVKYNPDAVLIYTGHNEYYGALGVGSTNRISGNAAIVKLVLELREFRLVQLINNAINAAKKKLSSEKVDNGESLMKKMAADQEITYQSEAYHRGIKQFENNLNEICQLLAKSKVPVFLSNLVSNEKDLKPMVSATTGKVPSADFAYKQANEAYANGDFDKVKQLFTKAKDLDLLRFRAPEAMNEVIKKITSNIPGVFLVDTKALFEQHSPHGILGNETLLEHVHPNLYGYALLSEAFYQSLKQHKMIAQQWKNEMSFEQLRREMPVTSVDSLKGAYEVMLLKQGWPFNQPIPTGYTRGNSFEEQTAAALLAKKVNWNDAMNKLIEYYLKNNNIAGAQKVAEAVMLEYPYDATFYAYAAKFSMNLNDNQKAVVYYKKAFELQPTFEVARDLVLTYLKLDVPEQAMPYVDYLVTNNTSRTNYSFAQQTIRQILKLKALLKTESANINMLNEVAVKYSQIGNKDVAIKYINQALQVNPANRESLNLLKTIKNNE